jgi:hypothetical protein
MSASEFHPLAELFPLIEGADFDALVEDIREHGVRDPIVFHESKVLDGRNRYRALVHLSETGEVLGRGWGHRAGHCLTDSELSPPHMWFVRYNETFEGDPLAWVISKNLKRRHLDESQRAMVAAKLSNMGRGRPGKEPAPDYIPQIHGISAKASAAMLNVGTRSIESARNVLRDGVSELQRAVEQGNVAVSTAETLTHVPRDEQNHPRARSQDSLRSGQRQAGHNLGGLEAAADWAALPDHLCRPGDALCLRFWRPLDREPLPDDDDRGTVRAAGWRSRDGFCRAVRLDHGSAGTQHTSDDRGVGLRVRQPVVLGQADSRDGPLGFQRA